LLWSELRGKSCEAFNNDMRVQISETGMYAYPDLSALCGPPEFADDETDVLLNPSVLIEVLSPSTEKYDRGAKAAHYRRLSSLQEYVFVAQDEVRIEHYRRQESGQWLLTELTAPDEVLELESIGARLRVADVYEKVELPTT
jgi:Uma2 family endonuclease